MDELHSGTETPSYFLGMDVNNVVSSYISWTFRTSYILLFGAFGICYFGLILCFSLLYLWVAANKPECITSGGVPIGSVPNSMLFSDCFHMSWTTFSTVGYGLVYPATGAEDFDVAQSCVALGVLGSFEAFMGVLYAGFCGAILFGKVLRSQNNAQVFFSDPIVIRFGKKELGGGVVSSGSGSRRISEEEEEIMEEGDEQQQQYRDEEFGGNGVRSWAEVAASQLDDNDDEGNTTNHNNIPCPSLEFRLVNRLHDISSGEIVEAKLSCGKVDHAASTTR